MHHQYNDLFESRENSEHIDRKQRPLELFRLRAGVLNDAGAQEYLGKEYAAVVRRR